ncbi:winged helix DNA-binding domain-containing protein [Amycolatopsis minnesotensis]|uniref:Winged helix DNA-binding domain-containing protein n=1 Tax=Amycolatopsis minnesotensis TaxID=337894 RepID=A0ABN2RWM2_9PSEU
MSPKPVKIGAAQRRARLGVRHHLAAPGPSPEEITASLLALHATDPATVYLTVAARSPGTVPDVERALYEDRALVRMLGMRRTVFVFDVETAGIVQAACTDDVAVKEHRHLVKHLTELGHPEPVADAEAWLAEVVESAARALGKRGAAFAQDLTADEPRLKQQLRMAPGKPYESVGAITSRVLFLLAATGRAVRGRPRGSWLSTQYRWSTIEGWLGSALPEWQAEDARAELAKRWLRAFGPAPVTDLRWWTGWTAAQAKKALARLDVVEADLDGQQGIVLADDVDDTAPVAEQPPWVALLPALDPTPMGWSDRGWYLGEHKEALFDRTGNIGPSVWSDGRIVGGWAQRPGGEVVFRLLSGVGAEAEAAIGAEADRLTRWLGETRVTPKFRTPLERELASS